MRNTKIILTALVANLISVSAFSGTVGNGNGGPIFDSKICRNRYSCTFAQKSDFAVQICQGEQKAQITKARTAEDGGVFVDLVQPYLVNQLSPGVFVDVGGRFALVANAIPNADGWIPSKVAVNLDNGQKIIGALYCRINKN